MWRFAGNDDKESVDFKAELEVDSSNKKKYYLKQVDLFYEVKLCTNAAQEKQQIFLDKLYTRRENK